MVRDASDILTDVMSDLKQHDPLVDQLDSPEAIYVSFPTEDRGFDLSVVLTPISDNSTPGRKWLSRTVRIQVTVTSTRQWREFYDNQDSQPDAITKMAEILGHVGDRLDRAKSVSPEIPMGSEGGPAPQPLDDGRIAMVGDWIVTGWYEDE